MEDAGGQRCVGTAERQHVGDVVRRARAARGDDRDGQFRQPREGVARVAVLRVPSWSIEVKRISPAPRSACLVRPRRRVRARWAARPPWVVTTPACRRRSGRRWPRRRTASRISAAMASISAGLATAALLRVILSAPASSSLEASSTDEMPPPTVNGMSMRAAMRATSSVKVPRSLLRGADVEVDQFVGPFGGVFRTQLHRDRRPGAAPTKLMPLTVCPSRMSRQGIMRLASIASRSLRVMRPS